MKNTSAPPKAPASLAHAEAPALVPTPAPSISKSYRTAQTRLATRQLSGHFPIEAVQQFRVLAARLDIDVQELLAQAVNLVFERYGEPTRIALTSSRRRRVAAPSPSNDLRAAQAQVAAKLTIRGNSSAAAPALTAPGAAAAKPKKRTAPASQTPRKV